MIKFRGKSIAENFNYGQWIYGNLIIDRDEAFIVNGIVESNDNYISLEEWCAVDIETVGQFTRMFDKNKSEIYEGDVVKVIDGSTMGGTYLGAIEHLEQWGLYGFNLSTAKVLKTNGYDKKSRGFLMTKYGNCFTLAEANTKDYVTVEVVGNLSDNPELLEQDEVQNEQYDVPPGLLF